MSAIPTGTVTFLFTDIEDSTPLWEQHPEAMKDALARHDALLRQAIEGRGGYVFKTVGDEFCSSFRAAPDALAAALAGQQALAREAWGEVGEIKVRMALHTAVAEERDGDYFGAALSRVARLRGLGHGGQVILSQATQELCRADLPRGTELRDMGHHRLRGLQQPERVFQLLHPGLPADFPPLKSLELLPNNLPRLLSSFVGREREMAEVKRLLATERLITLTGAGGCGKTRLALEVAADLLHQYPDGAWLAELAPLSSDEFVSQAVASALGVREEQTGSLPKALVEHLKAKQLLLVLDNCEHLVATCAALAEDLLQACPGLRILATSREILDLTGEVVWRVPSLSLPEPGAQPPVESLSQYEAVQLFVERAAAVQPGFALTAQNAAPIVQICRRLDGIPLAIELAATRLNVLSPAQIAERMDDRFSLLTGGSRTALPRQQTLQAAIDWSHDLLSADERCLLRRLSVFAGGWTLEATHAICADDDMGEYYVLDLLSDLVDKSLVLVGEVQYKPRYRLQETIREYAQEKLEESGEAGVARGAHRDWFLALADQAEPQLVGSEQGAWLDRLEREHDNLRAALAYSCENEVEGDVDAGLRLAGILARFWRLHGHLSEGRRWLEQMLAKGEHAPASVLARAVYGAGFLAYHQGDYGAAVPFLDRSLRLFRSAPDAVGEGDALQLLALVAWRRGEYDRAVALNEESLAVYRPLGDKRKLAVALNNLGLVVRRQGDYLRARALYEESLALKRDLGDEAAAAISLHNLGNIALDEERDYTRAAVLEQESLDIARRLSDKRGIAMALMSLGDIATRQAVYPEATSDYQESLVLLVQLGDRPRIAECIEGLAAVSAAQGEAERAASLLAAAWALRDVMGAPGSPPQQADYERTVRVVRRALGEEAFAKASARGRTMTLDQAVAYALDALASW